MLAWTVREGATNVIRHSGAHTCAIAVIAGLAGRGWGGGRDRRRRHGGARAAPRDGNGLAGLRERAAEIGGQLEAGSRGRVAASGWRWSSDGPRGGRRGRMG